MDGLIREASKLCIACNISFVEPGIAERVLRGDDSVCGRKNPEAFRQLRNHVIAFFQIEERAIERLGAGEVKDMLDEVRAAMQQLREPNRSGD